VRPEDRKTSKNSLTKAQSAHHQPPSRPKTPTTLKSGG
jgi:hypothetical protein